MIHSIKTVIGILLEVQSEKTNNYSIGKITYHGLMVFCKFSPWEKYNFEIQGLSMIIYHHFQKDIFKVSFVVKSSHF